MERVNSVIKHVLYVEHINNIIKCEEDRIYCHHDMTHFLDVARIASILAIEEKINVDRELIYTAALLHDIGRDEQYINGIAHEEASGDIAVKIMKDCGYTDYESKIIEEAIREHGNSDSKERKDITGIIYRADKLSRKCYACDAVETCHKPENKRVNSILY